MTHALHLTAWHPYIDGVSGVFVLEQCAALKAAGLEIGLIFSRIEGLRGLAVRRLLRGLPGLVRLDYPVRTLGFKSWNVPGGAQLAPRFNAWALQNRFKAYVRTYGRPDILHAHVALETGPAARGIATMTGLDYVLTEHSTEILNGCLTPHRRAIARAVYADARSVIAVSPILADRILDICPSANVRVIGNLIRDDVFALRRPNFETDGRIRVATIGALVPHKRVRNVIAALMDFPPPLKERIDYAVIGDGPERGMLEAAVREAGIRATFHGNLPHDHAMALLASMDLLIHASAYETFGVVLAEAMALGLPVVATRCGGPEGIVTDETGALVPVDDVEALGLATRAILQDLDGWRARRAAISQRAHDLYHETSIASAIAETYA